MYKFLTLVGLSLALLGCGAESDLAQKDEALLTQPAQSVAAPASTPAEIDKAATQQSQLPANIARDDDDDDEYRECREYRCERRCRRRGCRTGYCDDDYYRSRCVCRRC